MIFCNFAKKKTNIIDINIEEKIILRVFKYNLLLRVKIYSYLGDRNKLKHLSMLKLMLQGG